MKVPIRLRMTAWYVALLGAVVAALGAFLVFQLRADLTSAVDDGLRPATHEIARDVHDEGPPEFPDAARTVLKGERATGQLLTANGSVARRFGDAVNARPIVAPGAGEGIVTRRLDGQDFRVATLPVRGQGRIYVIVAGQSLAPVARSVRRVVILLLLAGPAALLTIALGGWWLARRALRPVNEITTAAEAIGGDRLGDRVPVPRADDELAHLARTLNTMLARIEHGAEEQRRLVADASHELRTPLAAMRAEIDVSLRADDLSPAARGVLLSAREEVDRLSRTVDDLLTIGAADDGALEMGREVTDLGHLVRTVASTLEPLARDRDVTVTASGPAVVATADPLRLGRALRNVVENAIEFSSPGSTVRISTSVREGSGRVVVEDDGPGIPDELRERVFDRFFRVDPSRSRATGGSGLGLSIVREIVAAHGGRAFIAPRAHGTAVVLELPARAGEPLRETAAV